MKRLMIGLMSTALLFSGSNALAWRDHHAPPSMHHRYPAPTYHHKHRDYRGAYLLGGLALGAVITDALIDRDRTVVYVEKSPPPRIVYRESPRTTVTVVQPERFLLRDLTGKCFEIQHDTAGNELRSQVPSAECVW